MPHLSKKQGVETLHKEVEKDAENEENSNKVAENVAEKDLYWVLENEVGARDVNKIATNKFLSPHRNAKSNYTVHYAGQNANAKALQMKTELKMFKLSAVEDISLTKMVEDEGF